MRKAPLVRGALPYLGSLGRRKLAQAPEESLDWSALQSFRI